MKKTLTKPSEYENALETKILSEQNYCSGRKVIWPGHYSMLMMQIVFIYRETGWILMEDSIVSVRNFAGKYIKYVQFFWWEEASGLKD